MVQVEMRETGVVRDQLQREGIELVSGTARFLPGAEGEPHRVMVLRTSEKTEAKTRSASQCPTEKRRTAPRDLPVFTSKVCVSA